MATSFTVVVEGGRPWGFTLQGGLEFRAPIRVGKVTPRGKAEKAGLISGDYITTINNTEVKGLKHLDAKQLVIQSTTTLELSCTKAAPSLFSPPGTKPAPQFSFTTPLLPSPSHITTGTRSRASSFTSPTHTRPQASSFTSPSHSCISTHTGPTTAPLPLTKTSSLQRPKLPAVPVAGGGRRQASGGKSVTPPNGRPKPPVTYHSDVGNSSSGVSSSVSSAASSPLERGHSQFSPSPRHHPSPPRLSPYHSANGYNLRVSSSPEQAGASSGVTTNAALDTGNTVTAMNVTMNTVPDGSNVAGDTASTAPDASDTANSAPDTSDTANSAPDTSDTANTAPDASDTANSAPDTSDTANTAPDTSDTANTAPDTSDTANTAPDASDTANSAPDTSDTANTAPDTSDTANTKVGVGTTVNNGDTANTTDNETTDAGDTTNMVADPADAASTITAPADTTDTIGDPIDTVNAIADTTNTIADTADTTNMIADLVDTADVIADPADTTDMIADPVVPANHSQEPVRDIIVWDDEDEMENQGGEKKEEVREGVGDGERETEGEGEGKWKAEGVEGGKGEGEGEWKAEGVEEGKREGEGEWKAEGVEGGKREGEGEGEVTVVEKDEDGEKEEEEKASETERKQDEGEGEEGSIESSQSLSVAGEPAPSRTEVTAPAMPTDQEQKSGIDRQLEEARRTRETEMKARAQSLLTGKLGSLVLSKPPLPPSTSIAKPPLPPAAMVTKSPQHVAAAVTKPTPLRPPLSPTGPLGGTRKEGKRQTPVIKPYLVKKTDERRASGPQKTTLPDRTMSDIKMAYRMPGWYKEMFQGFQQTVEELFPESTPAAGAIHARTKSSPADVETYVYDHRGLKVRRSSLSDSSPSSPVKTRPRSARTSTSDDTPDPVYVYDHRGLRVRKNSLSSSEIAELEATPTIKLDLQEEVTTADVLVSSRRQYSLDSGYDERGLRLRADSQGNGDTDREETGQTGEDVGGAVEVTKDDVIGTNRKPTSYRSDKFSTEPSRDYWSALDQEFAQEQRRKTIAEEQQEVVSRHLDNSSSSEQASPQHRMAHMHPLLRESMEGSSSSKPGEVFDRIDAQQLHGALENAKTLGTMEQEGVPSNLLPLQAQKEQPKLPEKLPPPGKKARALFVFEGHSEKELSFQKGAIIDLLHTVNENWLEGMVGQTKGIFPSTYVQVLSHEELRDMLASEKAPLMQVRASYDFDPQSERELKFSKGDIIAITKKIDENWYLGYLGDRKGIFPSSYVEILGENQ